MKRKVFKVIYNGTNTQLSTYSTNQFNNLTKYIFMVAIQVLLTQTFAHLPSNAWVCKAKGSRHKYLSNANLTTTTKRE